MPPEPPAASTTNVVRGGVVGFLVGAVVGVLLANYSPVTGDILSIHFAEPWSPARRNYETAHILICGIPAAVLAGWRASRPQMVERPRIRTRRIEEEP